MDSHTHKYAGSSSAGGSANSAVKLDTATAGSATQPCYFSGGKPVKCSYTLGKSVPSNAVFTDTNTWRGIQNNLTSSSTTDSLSANQGRILNASKSRIVCNGWGRSLTIPYGNIHGLLTISKNLVYIIWLCSNYTELVLNCIYTDGTAAPSYNLNTSSKTVTITMSSDHTMTYIGM